jgi:hypothetical protein
VQRLDLAAVDDHAAGNSYGDVEGGTSLTVNQPGSGSLQKLAGVPFDVETGASGWSSAQFRIQAVATAD